LGSIRSTPKCGFFNMVTITFPDLVKIVVDVPDLAENKET